MPASPCGLVILPPASVSDSLRQDQARAGAAYAAGFPPHLTLKSLFVPDAGIPAVERSVAGVCAVARPFTVTIGRLTVFPAPQGNFIVLRVAQARPLMRLHRQLIAALAPFTSLTDPAKDQQEVDGFVPHVTLLRDVPDSQVASVLAALARTPVRRTFSVEQITLVCQEQRSPWQETQRFPLGGDCGAPKPAAAASLQRRTWT
jgi:2'-5' RNA ligase